MSNKKIADATNPPLSVRRLDTDTWVAFAQLIEANNGVRGGCWCMSFHVKVGKGRTPQHNRTEKEQRVREGRTHASLVFAGDDCLGWCQFGSPAELPEIKRERRYEKDLTVLPDWRITCFFTGKGLRKRGVAHAALEGALTQISRNRRWHGRGLSRRDPRPYAIGILPPHRSHGCLREPRLHTDQADLSAPLGGHPHCRSGLRLPFPLWSDFGRQL
ncbi:GNAT family N-acetyltransferase [Streptomyces scabiei]|uniref:GNAT family N-acetyltransferase n=1 Tax=Streptomyces scabiei TaxID=1930 RepID=UPI0029ABBD61|nr:GNAT family N-acetyltransferase [Streptomyces scabiei]MDX2536438.1 GNAT family N-acetyltransferase [Streptomyces scabiei]MDX2799680.1 GNAT family N-acetyltransferase [Streptomyces scabiei]MDX2857520.1 GNAT family N-acetyltransferase [Streptomyces scabiei]MDX3829232.1 GNAT family N-acetyltransferase [Streptomyces scabiei]